VQIGSAREVFERPNNIFVARHLGQPSINEIPCRISDNGGQVALQSAAGNFTFTAGGVQRSLLRNGRGDVIVGIRPQHVRVANGVTSGQIAEAKVEAFEALGASGVLIAEVGGVPLTVLTSPEDDYEPGQPIRLALDVDQFLYFDPAQGNNLQTMAA